MKVAVICEYSGIVRDAFIARGHEAISCDILPTESLGPHRLGPMEDFDWSGFDLIIGHPPCTYLSNTSSVWLAKDASRWPKVFEAAAFFNLIKNLPCEKIAIENPIPHRYAVQLIGKKYDQIIQPWQFGHGETKATCLWLKGLPKLTPTDIVKGREQRLWRLPPSKDRAKLRSKTFQGIADAMADQWGAL